MKKRILNIFKRHYMGNYGLSGFPMQSRYLNSVSVFVWPTEDCYERSKKITKAFSDLHNSDTKLVSQTGPITPDHISFITLTEI